MLLAVGQGTDSGLEWTCPCKIALRAWTVMAVSSPWLHGGSAW